MDRWPVITKWRFQIALFKFTGEMLGIIKYCNSLRKDRAWYVLKVWSRDTSCKFKGHVDVSVSHDIGGEVRVRWLDRRRGETFCDLGLWDEWDVGRVNNVHLCVMSSAVVCGLARSSRSRSTHIRPCAARQVSWGRSLTSVQGHPTTPDPLGAVWRYRIRNYSI